MLLPGQDTAFFQLIAHPDHDHRDICYARPNYRHELINNPYPE